MFAAEKKKKMNLPGIPLRASESILRPRIESDLLNEEASHFFVSRATFFTHKMHIDVNSIC
jgi:hypothetical protein